MKMSQFNVFKEKKVCLKSIIIEEIPVVVIILYQWMQNIILVNLFYRKLTVTIRQFPIWRIKCH